MRTLRRLALLALFVCMALYSRSQRQSRDRCWTMVANDRAAFDRAIEKERQSRPATATATATSWRGHGSAAFANGVLRLDAQEDGDGGATQSIDYELTKQEAKDIGMAMRRWAVGYDF
jgi:hypothetical protein